MLSIAVIGGGAAGFMAAITAKRQMPNANVCIFEKGKKVLAKVAVTGGGRCNIKNSFVQDYVKKTISIPSNKQLTVHLAPGGGFTMKIN